MDQAIATFTAEGCQSAGCKCLTQQAARVQAEARQADSERCNHGGGILCIDAKTIPYVLKMADPAR
ncbi:MAG: hypothetical protein ACLTNH_15350 [Enterocloster sp.]